MQRGPRAHVMTPASWSSLAAVCLLGAMSPGPSLALVLRHTLSHSRRHGVAAALAHGLGVGLYAGLTAAGLGALYQQTPALRDVISIAGALYLLHLAWRAWRAGSHASALQTETYAAGESIWRAGTDGFLMAFLNPKVAVFFLALFSQFLTPDTGGQTKVLMAIMAAGVDATWYSVVACGLSRTPTFGALRRHASVIDRITAALLAAIALWVLFDVLT